MQKALNDSVVVSWRSESRGGELEVGVTWWWAGGRSHVVVGWRSESRGGGLEVGGTWELIPSISPSVRGCVDSDLPPPLPGSSEKAGNKS